jgi:hypothetical protein
MPPLHPQSEPGSSGYPGSMELYEMEGYVLQSLELLASTPTTQYYGPEVAFSELESPTRSANRSPQSAAVLRCKRSKIPSVFSNVVVGLLRRRRPF